MAQALAQAGGGSEDVIARFLFGMITKEERALVETLLPEPVEAPPPPQRSQLNDCPSWHEHGTRCPTTPRTSWSSTTTSASATCSPAICSSRAFASRTATDAASARAAMRGLAFDVVILDVMMPGESGLDLARDLKSISNIPICMLTARAEPEQRIEGLEAGVDDYVAKPFEPRELLLRLQNILKRGRGPSGPARRDPDGRFHVPRRRAAS